MSLWLAQRPAGRAALHLWAIARGGKVRWHIAGIVRELRKRR